MKVSSRENDEYKDFIAPELSQGTSYNHGVNHPPSTISFTTFS